MRRLPALGAAAVLAGFVVVFQRGLAGLFDVSYAFVTLVGVLAVLQGIRYALDRRRTDHVSLDLGDPERRYVVGVAGDDLDDEIGRSRGVSYGSRVRQDRLRERTRDVVHAELVGRHNYSPDEAATALDDGTWTDDRVAAAFLADSVPFPPSAWLRARIGGRQPFHYGLERTVGVLKALRGDAP